MRKLYPSIEPYRTGTLQVSDLHTIYYEEARNSESKPIVFLHGSPGGGRIPSDRQFFHPQK